MGTRRRLCFAWAMHAILLLGICKPVMALHPEQDLTISMILPLYSEEPSIDDAFWSAWQTLTGAKLDIEWVPSADYHTMLALKLSADDLPEVVSVPDVRTSALVNAIRCNDFWDLTPYLADFSLYPNLIDNQAIDAYKYLSVDDRIYALPRSRTQTDSGLKIRKDWLDKSGLPIPRTLEEYRQALRVMMDSDPDGNGRHDTIGLVAIGSRNTLPVIPFNVAFGAFAPQFDAYGGYIATQLNDGTMETIAFFRDLYADGTLMPEFPAIKENQAIELFTGGVAASFYRSIWWDYDWERKLHVDQPEAELVNLCLEGPKGYAVELLTGVAGGFYISSKVPEQKVLQILDYFERSASREAYDLAYFGVLGEHHTIAEDGTRNMTEQGMREITVSSKGAGVLCYDPWAKVDASNAPEAYNEKKRQEVARYAEVGMTQFMAHAISDTWSQIWPNYEEEWVSVAIKAIMGEVSMDAYMAYVQDLRDKPEFKLAFQELRMYYDHLQAGS